MTRNKDVTKCNQNEWTTLFGTPSTSAYETPSLECTVITCCHTGWERKRHHCVLVRVYVQIEPEPRNLRS